MVRYSGTMVTVSGVPPAVDAAIAPFLAANREIKDLSKVDELHSFFQKAYRTPATLSHALCVCAQLGKVRQIPFLLEAGADAGTRCTDTQRLVHNIVLGLEFQEDDGEEDEEDEDEDENSAGTPAAAAAARGGSATPPQPRRTSPHNQHRHCLQHDPGDDGGGVGAVAAAATQYGSVEEESEADDDDADGPHDDAFEALVSLYEAHWEVDHNTRQLLAQDPERKVLFANVCIRLAQNKWKIPQTGGNVLHGLLEAARGRILDEAVVLDACVAVLEAFSSRVGQEWMQDRNKLGQTPRDIAVLLGGLEEYSNLHRLFVTVVFQRFRVGSEKALYKSATSDVRVCHDLERGPNSDYQPLVIKLMRNKVSWEREISARQQLRSATSSSATSGGGSSAGVVGIVCCCSVEDMNANASLNEAGGSCDGDGDGNSGGCYDSTFFDGLEVLSVAREAVAHASAEAQDMMRAFPYALVMCRAELNLLEAIQNERLASEPLPALQQIAYQLGASIGQLHDAGLVHGDIKPRNICRFGTRYRLIDFDKAFEVGTVDPTVGQSSTAYAAPELVQYIYRHSKASGSSECHADAAAAAEAAGGADVKAKPVDLTPEQVDIWSFGVTLFEMCAGAPLFNNSYDLVTQGDTQRLLNWSGLGKDDLVLVESQHGAAESTALVDLLLWILDGEPATRPTSMAMLLEHAFFNPTDGTMREHFVVDEIKRRLEEGEAGGGGGGAGGAGAKAGDAEQQKRIDCRVMISYCWADTSFALHQLAMELASDVTGMWLDRLGGAQGMGEFAQASMQRGVKNADVVIAVVSPSYLASTNCGYEMELAAKLRKPIVPIVLGVPFSEWPPTRVGSTEVTDQFATSSGDLKIFVDMTSREQFYQKYRKELLPKLARGDDGNFSSGGGDNAAAASAAAAATLPAPVLAASATDMAGVAKVAAEGKRKDARIKELEIEVKRLKAVLSAFL